MTHQKLQVIGFFVLLSAALLIVGVMVWPFFEPLALAGILAMLFLPVAKKITAKLGSETWGSLLTVLLVLLVVILPLWLFGQLIFNELIVLYDKFKHINLLFDQTAFIQHFPEPVRRLLQTLNHDSVVKLTDLASQALQTFTRLLLNLPGFLLIFFFVFFVLYYFLRDGGSMAKYFNEIFPLSEAHENLIVTKLQKAITGVVNGTFILALLHGAVALLGFWALGVPQPILWAAFTVLASFVPTVGTVIAIGVAALYLVFTGHTGEGIALAVWGVLSVGFIDNFISPKLIGSKANLHPVLAFLGILGGLKIFGLLGFLLGPIIMAVLVTLLNIYRTDLKLYLEK